MVIRAGAQRAAERLRHEQDAHEAEQERQDPQPVDQWIVGPIDARELLRRQRDRQVDRRVDPAGLRHRVAQRREVGGSTPQPHRVGQVEDAVREGTGERGRQVDAGFALRLRQEEPVGVLGDPDDVQPEGVAGVGRGAALFVEVAPVVLPDVVDDGADAPAHERDRLRRDGDFVGPVDRRKSPVDDARLRDRVADVIVLRDEPERGRRRDAWVHFPVDDAGERHAAEAPVRDDDGRPVDGVENLHARVPSRGRLFRRVRTRVRVDDGVGRLPDGERAGERGVGAAGRLGGDQRRAAREGQQEDGADPPFRVAALCSHPQPHETHGGSVTGRVHVVAMETPRATPGC